MHTRFVIVAGVLALGATSAFAGEIMAREDAGVTSRTRAQVKAEVLEARTRGQLAPAGEAGLPAAAPVLGDATRAEVQDDVRLARQRGELVPAGEADPFGAHEFAATSDRTRAEVKAETLAARRAGELAPAGETYDGSFAQAKAEPGKNPFTRLARLMRK